MGSTIEWIVGIVRSGANHRKLGDPYEFSATVVKEGDAAHLMAGVALSRASTKSLRDCLRVLKLAGIRRARWERAEDGSTRNVEVDL